MAVRVEGNIQYYATRSNQHACPHNTQLLCVWAAVSLQVPLAVRPVAVLYNGDKDISFSACTLYKIFSGTISRWLMGNLWRVLGMRSATAGVDLV